MLPTVKIAPACEEDQSRRSPPLFAIYCVQSRTAEWFSAEAPFLNLYLIGGEELGNAVSFLTGELISARTKPPSTGIPVLLGEAQREHSRYLKAFVSEVEGFDGGHVLTAKAM